MYAQDFDIILASERIDNRCNLACLRGGELQD